MSFAPNKFGDLLTNAIYAIRSRTGQDIAIIQDQLGFALGRGTGGSSIVYWRKGHIPSKTSDLEQLGQLLVAQEGLDWRACSEFLRAGGHPAPEQLLSAWFNAKGLAPPAIATVQPSSTPLNPFVVGPPITEPRQFYGRERELRRLFSRWQGFPLEHFALIGPRRSGKSSLLHYLRRIITTPPAQLRPAQKYTWLPQPERVRWLFIDFQDVRMQRPELLLPYLLTELDLAVPQPCTLERFMEKMTIQPWSQPSVILLDELEAGLASPALDAAFWQSWRALINNPSISGHLAFVAAVHEPTLLASQPQKTSPFVNLFNMVTIGPFDETEARQLIASSPQPFHEADVEWILTNSGGWPFLIQLLCDVRFEALTEGEAGNAWQVEGLRRITPFRYLL